MEFFKSIEESKSYFDKNISPCSVTANKLVNWNNLNSALLITAHSVSNNQDLENHVATKQSGNEIEANSNSDEKLLQWLKHHSFMLITRDFALDKPINREISENESVFLEKELFYVIEPKDTNAKLKLSLSKSWIFFGYLVKNHPEHLSSDDVMGIAMGVHKLDSYLIVT